LARRWTKAEDQLLRQLYADQLPVADISSRLKRSPDAVVARRSSLGVPSRRGARWSRADDALLRAGTAAGLSAAVLAQRLSRPAGQVRARRGVLLGRKPARLPYLPDEDEAIRVCLGHGGDVVALAHRLGRSPDALRLHARHLGLHRPRPRRRWAEWEDALIRDGYTSALPCAEIARQLPQRTTASVAARAHKLGLISYARRWSTDDDLRLMRLTAQGSTLEDVAQRLGRTPEAIRRRSSRLGLARPAPASAPRHARRWTPEEDELLRLHHAVNPARLAELLGRSDVAVCRRLCAIGLRARAQRSPHHPGNGPVARTDARRNANPRRNASGSPRRPVQVGAPGEVAASRAGAGAMRMYGRGA
jgi:hypothetical protein